MLRLFPLFIAALIIVSGLPAAAAAPPFVPGSWTLVILPDTQNYTSSYPAIFTNQTQWIRDNAVTRNIKYVLQEGDVTNNNYASQWQNAKNSMSLLDGVVPYAMVPGNHDCLVSNQMTNRQSLLSTYFLSAAQSMPTFGGTYEAGNLNNSYHLFSAGGRDWIIIGLEWAPRDAVLTWVNGLLDTYSNRTAMIFTHAYLYSDETRYDWAVKGTTQAWNPNSYNTSGVMTGGVNDGEQIWQKCAKLHSNVMFIFNGHVLNDGAGRLISAGVYGNLVFQILANYQMRAQGGEGYLRLLEFQPDGKTVKVYSYSPYLNTCLTDSQQQFELSLTTLLAPSNPGATNKTTSSMRFTWQDNSNNETGFKLYYDAGTTATTLRATLDADVTYYDLFDLPANAPYTFQVQATNADGDSAKTAKLTTLTLADPPSIGNNVICDKNPGQPYPLGTTFTFSNPIGFGYNGPYKVTRFRYFWDTSPACAWTGGYTWWTSGTFIQTPTTAGDYYLHLQSYNGGIPSDPNPSTLDYGPFHILSEDGSIAAVKTLAADDPVRLGNKHLHRNCGSFGYIQEPDRTSGIRIEGGVLPAEGSLVSLVGRLARPAGSERCVLVDGISAWGPAEIRPLGISNIALSSQLATGLCVKTWGMVKAGSVTSNSFVLDDISGVRVITDGEPGVAGGQLVIVTGALGFDGSLVIYATQVQGL